MARRGAARDLIARRRMRMRMHATGDGPALRPRYTLALVHASPSSIHRLQRAAS
jgi:hypothetical protein